MEDIFSQFGDIFGEDVFGSFLGEVRVVAAGEANKEHGASGGVTFVSN